MNTRKTFSVLTIAALILLTATTASARGRHSQRIVTPAGCNAYGCWPDDGGCNAYGCWTNGGGCNAYGCWNSPQGSCNAYGCTNVGACNAYGCPG